MSTKRITADTIRTVTSNNGTDHKAIRSTDVRVSITKGSNYPANTTKIAIESRYGIQPREASLLNITFADGTVWSGNVTELQAALSPKDITPTQDKPLFRDSDLAKHFELGTFTDKVCTYVIERDTADDLRTYMLTIISGDDVLGEYAFYKTDEDALADVDELATLGINIEAA